MFSRGDIVYLYLFNLRDIIDKAKKIYQHRFGKIKEMTKVEASGTTFNEYKIELLDGFIVTIKEYAGAFKICNTTELQSAILESSKLIDTEKDILIEEVHIALESFRAK